MRARWGVCETVASVRLTTCGKRKGVRPGPSREREFAAAPGRAGLGCERRSEPASAFLARRTSEPACHGNSRLGSLIWQTGLGENICWKTVSWRLSPCASGLGAVALPPRSLSGEERESQATYCSLILDPSRILLFPFSSFRGTGIGVWEVANLLSQVPGRIHCLDVP